MKEVNEQTMRVSGERVFVLVRRNNNCRPWGRRIFAVFEKQKEEACIPLFWELRGETGRRWKRDRGCCRADKIGPSDHWKDLGFYLEWSRKPLDRYGVEEWHDLAQALQGLSRCCVQKIKEPQGRRKQGRLGYYSGQAQIRYRLDLIGSCQISGKGKI